MGTSWIGGDACGIMKPASSLATRPHPPTNTQHSNGAINNLAFI